MMGKAIPGHPRIIALVTSHNPESSSNDVDSYAMLGVIDRHARPNLGPDKWAVS